MLLGARVRIPVPLVKPCIPLPGIKRFHVVWKLEGLVHLQGLHVAIGPGTIYVQLSNPRSENTALYCRIHVPFLNHGVHDFNRSRHESANLSANAVLHVTTAARLHVTSTFKVFEV